MEIGKLKRPTHVFPTGVKPPMQYRPASFVPVPHPHPHPPSRQHTNTIKRTQRDGCHKSARETGTNSSGGGWRRDPPQQHGKETTNTNTERLVDYIQTLTCVGNGHRKDVSPSRRRGTLKPICPWGPTKRNTKPRTIQSRYVTNMQVAMDFSLDFGNFIEL